MATVISVSQRGSLTLPKAVRDRLGIGGGGQLLLDVNDKGDVLLRPDTGFPVESYTQERVAEFDAMNNGPLKGRKLRFRKAR